jgi:chromate transporter
MTDRTEQLAPFPESGESPTTRATPLELLRTFLIMGLVGFGGPAAHIALMERQIVVRRAWLSRPHFLNLLAIVNLVPGPNSTEMAFHIGLVMGGLRGCILAGLGFIGPAVALSTGLAMVYVAAETLPAIQGVLAGVKPVILVLILSAAYRLGQKALDDRAMRSLFGLAMLTVLAGITPLMAALGLAPVNVHELALLLASGLVYVVYRGHLRALPGMAVLLPAFGAAAHMLETIRPTLADLFARFLVIGATLFGSGLILVAYMDRSFVQDTGWLTPQQLVDTLAIGQATPGPVLSTAAAAGYIMTATPGDLLSGVPAAVLSSVAVFTPAFFIVLLLGRLIPILGRSPAALDFLKGVNAGVIALLIGAFINLAWSTVIRVDSDVDWIAIALTGLAFVALERLRWEPALLIVVGAGIGLARAGLGLL